MSGWQWGDPIREKQPSAFDSPQYWMYQLYLDKSDPAYGTRHPNKDENWRVIRLKWANEQAEKRRLAEKAKEKGGLGSWLSR